MINISISPMTAPNCMSNIVKMAGVLICLTWRDFVERLKMFVLGERRKMKKFLWK
jgi:hypothetical protein